MLTCHLQLKIKSNSECPFLLYRLFEKVKHLPLQSTVNLPLVEFIHILTGFTYKFGTVYTLTYRCFQICLSWSTLHTKLVCLKQVFLKSRYPENFVNKCFKSFMNDIHIVKETTLTVEKKPPSTVWFNIIHYILGLS